LLIASLKEFLPDLESSLLAHPFFERRMHGLAPIDLAAVKKWNITGPNARATGMPGIDLRTSRPYGAYRGVTLDSSVLAVAHGDAYDRARIRKSEILQSVHLIEAVFRRIPSGNHRIRVGLDVRPSPGKAVCNVEGPRGAIYALVETDGRAQPAQVSFICPSAMAVQMVPALLRGIQVEDTFLVIHSLDISFSEVDK
jgi:NADH-quinone oxidoreductase subunit D